MKKIKDQLCSNEPIVITATKEMKYLGDVVKELPANTLFNKGKTGCGGTELEIKAERHSIIAAPFTGLIICKSDQKGNQIVGVFSGVSNAQIIEYLQDATIPYKKIMVTYDSIERVISCIKQSGLKYKGRFVDPYEDFFLLIDEYHVLLNQYVFRHDSISNLLKVFPNFKSVCFLSATPIERDFMLQEIKHFRTVTVEWPFETPIGVRRIESKSPRSSVIKLIQQRLQGKSYGNLHIFLNSVTSIAKVIKEMKLESSVVKIVCALNSDNQLKLGKSHSISHAFSPAKLINFYTSNAFEGVDIFDEEGRTIIVSEGDKAHTLYDISTLFIQICGRIRNSKYNTEVTHIYSKTHRYLIGDRTYQDFIAGSEVQVQTDVDYMNFLNEIENTEHRKRTIDAAISKNSGNPYLRLGEDGKVHLDTNRVMVDRMNFKVLNYYSNSLKLASCFKENGFDTNTRVISDSLKANNQARVPFRVLFELYVSINSESGIGNKLERLQDIEFERPLIKQAYEKLGIEQVREMKYHVGNISRILSRRIGDSEEVSVMKMIDGKLRLNTPLKLDMIKGVLLEAYKTLRINRAPKVRDLENWYNVERQTVRFKAVQSRTITLLSKKIIFG